MMNHAGSLYWEPISLLLTLCCLTQFTLETDPKAILPPFVLIRSYAGKWICSASCGEYAGNSFVPVALQQCIPVGRHAIPWYGGLVRCAKFLHILFRLSQFCFWWPFLSVKQKALCTYSNTIICKSPELTDSSQLLPWEKMGRKKSSGGSEGLNSTGMCDAGQAYFSSLDILGGLH